MSYVAAALGLDPVAYAVQKLNAQLNEMDKKSGGATRNAFTRRLHDVVIVLNDVQLVLSTIASQELPQVKQIFTAALNLAATAQSFVNEFDDLHRQVDSLQQKYEAVSMQAADLQKELDFYRVYGDWVAKLHRLVAQQLATTWAQLAEYLAMEEDATDDPWTEGEWHQKVAVALKNMSMTHDEWQQLGNFSDARNSMFHDKEWKELRTRAEKSSKATRDMAALDSIPAHPMRLCLQKAIKAVVIGNKWPNFPA